MFDKTVLPDFVVISKVFEIPPEVASEVLFMILYVLQFASKVEKLNIIARKQISFDFLLIIKYELTKNSKT